MSTNIIEAWNGPGPKDSFLTEVQPVDHGLHPSTSKLAFEHWYFDARLDTGHTVVGFITKRRPEETPWAKPSVELLVYSPDGTKRQVRAHYPKAEASFALDDVNASVGPNTCWVDRSGDLPVQHLYMAEEDVVFDLQFHNELPSWMPGRGETHYNAKESFGWVVAAPRARVTGTVTIGDLTLDAAGIGYADHNWGAGDMKRIIERWHWGRLYLPDYSVIFANVMTQKRFDHHRSQPVMLAKNGDIVLSTGEVELTEGPMVFHANANREYPTWVEISSPGQFNLRLDVERIIDSQDLLDEVPVIRRIKPLIRKLVGRPGYFRYDSRFVLTLWEDGPEGVTEVTRTGNTLHEMVALA